MSNHDPPHHSKPSHNVLDKLTNKISAIKGDLTEAVKERSRSFSSDRYNSISSSSINAIVFSLKDDTQSMKMQTEQSFKTSGKC